MVEKRDSPEVLLDQIDQGLPSSKEQKIMLVDCKTHHVGLQDFKLLMHSEFWQGL